LSMGFSSFDYISKPVKEEVSHTVVLLYSQCSLIRVNMLESQADSVFIFSTVQSGKIVDCKTVKPSINGSLPIHDATC